MSDPTLKQQVTDAITSLVAHEGSVSEWVNGDTATSYTTSGGDEVPSIRKFIADSFNYVGEYTASTAYILGQTFRGATSVNDADTYRMFRVTTAFNSGSDALVSEGVAGKYEVLFDLSAVKDAMDSATASETAAEDSKDAAALSETASKDSEDAAAISAAAALSMEPHRIVTPAINAAGVVNAYPGAKAAYSTRNLDGQMATTSVVNVRRASDNKQKDFTARDILDGSMLNWVNADVDTLPLDVQSRYDVPEDANISIFPGQISETRVQGDGVEFSPITIEGDFEISLTYYAIDDGIEDESGDEAGRHLLANSDAGGRARLAFGDAGSSTLTLWSDGSISSHAPNWTNVKLTYNDFNHIRLVREGSVYTLYFNGENMGSKSDANYVSGPITFNSIGKERGYSTVWEEWSGAIVDINIDGQVVYDGYGVGAWTDRSGNDNHGTEDSEFDARLLFNRTAAAAYSLRDLSNNLDEITVTDDTIPNSFVIDGLATTVGEANNGKRFVYVGLYPGGTNLEDLSDVYNRHYRCFETNAEFYLSISGDGIYRWRFHDYGLWATSSASISRHPWEATGWSSGEFANITFSEIETKGEFVTQVRRASDDTKRSFTAAEVAGTELTDWVNGEVALPLDTTTFDNLPKPSGAYSVHNLDPNYTGDVITVRRSSDDTELDFSGVEVAGSTMVDWVNAVTVTQDCELSVGFQGGPLGTATASGGYRTKTYVFTGATTGESLLYRTDYFAPDLVTDATSTLSFTITGLTGGSVEIYRSSLSGTQLAEITSDGSYTVPFTGSGSQENIYLTVVGTSVDFTLSAWYATHTLPNDGHVTKWYDQSGSTDAIVALEDQQKVVDGGSPIDGLQKPAAAYSLRDLSGSRADLTSSGDTTSETTGALVAQVRRSSDDEIKSFTAAEVAGSTMVDWVNTDVDVYTSDFGSGIDGWGTSSSLLSIVNTGVDGTSTPPSDDWLRIQADGRLQAAWFSASNLRMPVDGGTVTISTDLYLPTGNAWIGGKVPIQNFHSAVGLSSGQVFNSNEDAVIGLQTVTWTITLPAYTPANSAWRLGNTSSDVTSVSYVKNFEVTQTAASGHVATWYDQSGNDNHAVQATPASQPKVVDGGNFLGLVRTDGVNDFFDLTTQINFNSNHGLFALFADNGAGRFNLLGKKNTYTDGIGWSQISATDKSFSMLLSSGQGQNVIFTNADKTQQNLISLLWQPDSLSVLGAHNGTQQTAAFVGSSFLADTPLVIDSMGILMAAGGQLDLKEIIIYNSDQTDNRKAIESNIADYHNIDLPAGFDSGNDEVDGYVATWYDQSGNGNNAVQAVATSQPKIVEDGVLVADGIKFDGGQSLVKTTFTQGPLSQPNTAFAVSKMLDVGSDVTVFDGSGGGRNMIFASSSYYRFYAGTIRGIAAQDTDQHLFTALFNTTNSDAYIDGVIEASSVDVSTDSMIGITIGARYSLAYPLNGTIQEIIIYNSDQTDNRKAIESNMAVTHDIDMLDGYDPGNDKVDGYVTTWYDQSGYGNHATQDVATSQPKIVEEGNYLGLIRTDNVNGFFNTTNTIDFNSGHSLFASYADDGGDRFSLVGGNATTGHIGWTSISASSTNFGMIAPGGNQSNMVFALADKTQRNVVSVLWNNESTGLSGSVNGAYQSVPFNVGSTTFINDTPISISTIGKGPNATGKLDLTEIIIYDSDQSNQRINIEDNLAVTHDITLDRWTS